jgi:hypothetical protein
MRRGREEEDDEEEEEHRHQGPPLMPVLHFCNDAQRNAFVAAMAIPVVSDETLGAQGLSELPGERDLHVIIYKLCDEKNVVTVTQLPGRGLHESMNVYSHMLQGQGLKVPHPMIPEFHEHLGRYLSMEISNDDAFVSQIYPEPPAEAVPREPLRRRRRIDFPVPPPLQMVQMVLGEFGLAANRLFIIGGGDGDGDDVMDLSAPGPVERKPAPEEPLVLEEEWEKKLGKPEKIDGMPDCALCLEYSATIVLYPCGHRFGCDDCFRKLMKSKSCQKVCTRCRNDFKTFVKNRD